MVSSGRVGFAFCSSHEGCSRANSDTAYLEAAPSVDNLGSAYAGRLNEECRIRTACAVVMMRGDDATVVLPLYSTGTCVYTW
jgi:hypothetical protein